MPKSSADQLRDNLNEIEDIKGQIRQAIIAKETEVPLDTPFSEYPQKIEDIQTKEDLDNVLNTQDEKIAQLEAALENKAAGGKIKLNVYAQTTEPTDKDGIWLQTDKTFDKVYFDTNTVKAESWDNHSFNPVPSIGSYASSAVCIGTNIFIFAHNSNIVYKYDTLTDTYTRLSDSPMKVDSGGAVSYGTDIFLMKNSDTSSSIVYKYDTLTDTYTRLSDSPKPTYSAKISIVDNFIYLIGCRGYYFSYKYNILTNTYTSLNNPPDVSMPNTHALVGSYIYYINTSNGTSYKYNISNDTYSTITKCPNIGNGEAAAIAYENCIYIFGSSVVYKYNTLTNTYTNIINKKYTNNNETIVRCGDRILLFSGGNRPNDLFKFILEGKDYDDESVVISQTFGNYHTIVDDVTNIIAFFNNVYYYTTENGLDDTIPTYYGDGTQWIKFKN